MSELTSFFCSKKPSQYHKKVCGNKDFCNVVILPEYMSTMSTISSFKNMKSKHDVYRGKDYMKKFYESLRENATKTINKKLFKKNCKKLKKKKY